jgi:fumarate reductase subunit C
VVKVHGVATRSGVMVNATEYVPRSYRPRVSTYWWVARWPYLKFILREASSVFVAWTVVLTLLQIRAIERGAANYASFQDSLRNPFMLALSLITLLFVVFHAITWFNLAPKAMAIHVGGKRLSELAIAAPNYIVWIVVSGVVAWILLRG